MVEYHRERIDSSEALDIALATFFSVVRKNEISMLDESENWNCALAVMPIYRRVEGSEGTSKRKNNK